MQGMKIYMAGKITGDPNYKLIFHTEFPVEVELTR